jgi:hypothetical protein
VVEADAAQVGGEAGELRRRAVRGDAEHAAERRVVEAEARDVQVALRVKVDLAEAVAPGVHRGAGDLREHAALARLAARQDPVVVVVGDEQLPQVAAPVQPVRLSLHVELVRLEWLACHRRTCRARLVRRTAGGGRGRLVLAGGGRCLVRRTAGRGACGGEHDQKHRRVRAKGEVAHARESVSPTNILSIEFPSYQLLP